MAGTISHGQTAHTIYISSGFFSCSQASIERGPSLDKTETQFHEALMHVPRHCANVSHPLANCRTCALTRCASYARGSAGRGESRTVRSTVIYLITHVRHTPSDNVSAINSNWTRLRQK